MVWNYYYLVNLNIYPNKLVEYFGFNDLGDTQL